MKRGENPEILFRKIRNVSVTPRSIKLHGKIEITFSRGGVRKLKKKRDEIFFRSITGSFKSCLSQVHAYSTAFQSQLSGKRIPPVERKIYSVISTHFFLFAKWFFFWQVISRFLRLSVTHSVIIERNLNFVNKYVYRMFSRQRDLVYD